MLINKKNCENLERNNEFKKCWKAWKNSENLEGKVEQKKCWKHWKFLNPWTKIKKSWKSKSI